MFKVIDDFLPNQEFNELCSLIANIEHKLLPKFDLSLSHDHGQEYDLTTTDLISSTILQRIFNTVTNLPVSKVNCWISTSKPMTSVVLHDHSDSGTKISCLLYLKASTDSGILEFPKLGEKIIPEKNKLVVFESNDQHLVSVNMSESNRTCVALDFNF
jgi:hypothetical protein